MTGPFHGLRAGIAVLGLWAALASPAAAALNDQDHHSFAEVDRQLQEWSREHPREMQLLTIGRSAGGRPLYVARIAAPGGGDPVAPALNPDAHDALFGTPRSRRAGNAMKVDHDLDGRGRTGSTRGIRGCWCRSSLASYHLPKLSIGDATVKK